MFDVQTLRRWLVNAVAKLDERREEINQLNVFPVADSDTGDNLTYTLAAGLRALPDPSNDMAAARLVRQFATAALVAAKGSSGVIIAAWFAGFARALSQRDSSEGLAAVLAQASISAHRAVADPVAGTILTIAKASAECDADSPARETAHQAAHLAQTALGQTPSQLPALSRAGVVDAGGLGLVVILRALADTFDDVETSGDLADQRPDGQKPKPGAEFPSASQNLSIHDGIRTDIRSEARFPSADRAERQQETRYEVQYQLVIGDTEAELLSTELARIGDSVVVAGEHHRHVHVHTADAGAALQLGVDLARVSAISVTALPPASGHTIVVLARGPGLVELCVAAGARVLDTHNEQELQAILNEIVGAVVLFPNDEALADVCDAVAARARRKGQRVVVVHTRSPVQALAALAVHDPHRPFNDDVLAMAEAARSCRWARIETTESDAWTMAGRAASGDVLGIVEGDVAAIGIQPAAVGADVVDRMLGAGGELLTLVAGRAMAQSSITELTDHIARSWPYVECRVVVGKQSDTLLLIGVE